MGKKMKRKYNAFFKDLIFAIFCIYI